MTTRSRHCIVTFDEDIRTDDFEHYQNALHLIKGVASVRQLGIDEAEDMDKLAIVAATESVKADWREKFADFQRSLFDW